MDVGCIATLECHANINTKKKINMGNPRIEWHDNGRFHTIIFEFGVAQAYPNSKLNSIHTRQDLLSFFG
jgi:hypothetical protein